MNSTQLAQKTALLHLTHNPEVVAGEQDRLIEMAETSRWQQIFGTTTGPFEGYGGAAMTEMTITAVKIDRWIAWYVNDRFAVLTSGAYGEAAFVNKKMPAVQTLQSEVPSWCSKIA